MNYPPNLSRRPKHPYHKNHRKYHIKQGRDIIAHHERVLSISVAVSLLVALQNKTLVIPCSYPKPPHFLAGSPFVLTGYRPSSPQSNPSPPWAP